MKVSVVIPVYNSQDTLRKLLHSIGESDPADKEVIVVDDGSTDGGVMWATEPGARVFRLEHNSGPAAARNTGVHAATGEVVLFLDADVVIPPHLIAHVAHRFSAEPGLIGLNGYYDPQPLNSGLYPRYKALYINYFFQDKKETEVLETCVSAVRRDILIELGGFDTRYRGADVEDYELGYRIAQRGMMEIDHQMVVGHHFPGFIKNAKNFFRRSAMWTELYWQRRKFDTAVTTQSEGVNRLIAAATGLLLLLGLLGVPWLTIPVLLGFAAFIYLNRGFFAFVQSQENRLFLLVAIFFYLADSVVIMTGAAAGTLRHFLRRARGAR